MLIRRLSRTGDSYYVVIPRVYRTALALRHHDYLTMSVQDGALVLRKFEPPAQPALPLARASRGAVGRPAK